MDLSKRFLAKKIESRIYQKWEKAKAFKPKGKGRPFVIAIPPPNITGSLHLGHALNNTVQDVLIRFHRMQGEPTLWIPGTDHAGIATQNVVEKALKKRGRTRHDLGREKFIKAVWAWKKKYGDRILEQLKKMGCSCNWDYLTFTLDEDYQKAVLETFVHYYKKGWIYQGERVVNWCPRCQSTLSDLEVEYKEQRTPFYYFKYGPVIIGTARPETKFSDKVIVVHPKDKRYKDLINKEFELEWINGKVKAKVIADEAADMKLGSGAMTITPAHSLVDFELAKKHKLEVVQIIDKRGRLTAAAGEYQGMGVKQARQKVVEILKKKGLLEKIDHDYVHNLSVCYRCDTPVEPLPSKQWFVKMDELKKPAIKALREGKIEFIPARFKRICLDWLEKSYDWCISRQLWWGHRLPVWKKKTKIYVGIEPPKGAGWVQSEDVLDTWFSSALWSFATLGWTKPGAKTKDLEKFHPTTVLSTARDIIFLWVGRMIFSSLDLVGEIPFKKVYVHPTVLNIKGQRMSKSLGTGVDPIEMIDKYGADATRFGLMYQNTGVQDMRFSESNIVAARNFCNKLWNVSRFILMNVGVIDSESQMMDRLQNPDSKTAHDKKILKELGKTVGSVAREIDNFQFGQAAHRLYDFVWHSLADQYLEESKDQLKDDKLKQNTRQILLYVLVETLKLLHPFMPFITEEIWGRLYGEKLVKEKLLITTRIDVGR
jgi:valyl-tRNA synthetase